MWQPIIFGALAGGVTVVGILSIKLWHRQALRYSHYINSFAAGLIVTAALVALLPEAMKHSEAAPIWAVGGFFAFLVLESFLVVHSGAEVHYPRPNRRAAQGMVFFWGLFLHSLLDGAVIAIAFNAGTKVGLLTALAVVGHELPEGITTFSLLLERIDERKALKLALAVAVATPAGVVVATLAFPSLGDAALGAVVGLVAGSFLYIGASDIVPEIREEQAVGNTIFLLAGVLFMVVLTRFLGH